MLSVIIVCVKIITGTFCYCLSYGNLLIMASGKELNNSQKALIVRLWKDGDSYRKISSNLNIALNTISSFIARFKRHNTGENKKRTAAQGKFQDVV